LPVFDIPFIDTSGLFYHVARPRREAEQEAEHSNKLIETEEEDSD